MALAVLECLYRTATSSATGMCNHVWKHLCSAPKSWSRRDQRLLEFCTVISNTDCSRGTDTATRHLFGLWSRSENPKRYFSITYHRGIEAAHGGKVSCFTLQFAWLHEVVGVGGPFDVRQAFAPGWGAHEPQEGKNGRHHQVLAQSSTQWIHDVPPTHVSAETVLTCSFGVFTTTPTTNSFH